MSTTTPAEKEKKHWSPPGDYDWGEGTKQARQQRENPEEDPAPDWWTDAYEIRCASELFRETPAPFDPDNYQWPIYPDTLIHEKPPDEWDSEGGTDWAAVGRRGSGKTTHNRQYALRLMESNPEEKIVWRGDPSRSGWTDFREWATVWLPENATVDARWKSEVQGVAAEPVDVEDEVRQVRRYEDPVDLLNELGDEPGGTFHVVYPDPSFTGCEELSRQTNRVAETLPFVPEWAAIGDESPTPLQHWWFAFLLAAVEFRESMYWLSLIFDEAGDLAPEDAEDGEHRTWKKVALLRSIYASSRKFRLSLYWAYHYESNIHEKFRKEIERRISMADGTSNPTQDRTRSVPLGFDSVPMYSDLIGHKDKGWALLYEAGENGHFCRYSFKDLSRIGEDDRWLKIDLGEPERDDDTEEDEGPTLEYDRTIFKRWSAGDEDRLYVRDPGAGYIDVFSGAEPEPLESPKDSLKFGAIREEELEYVVTMLPQDSDEEIVVARLPKRDLGLADGEGGGDPS